MSSSMSKVTHNQEYKRKKRTTTMIKRITLLIAIGLLGLISDARMKPLRFVNGTFKIVQFTDLHWVEDSSFKTKNDSTLNLMRDILNAEKPDLAVITGDVVVGSNAKLGWDKICTLFEEIQVPFVVTFGNHDHESDMSNAEILEYIADKPYNLTFDEDRKIHGSGNCSMPVKASEGSGDKWMLYFFDSNSYPKDKFYGTYDWIHHDQIEWYRNTGDKIRMRLGHALPSLAFFHIPLPEYGDTLLVKKIVGNKHESVCSPKLNSGLFSAFLEQGDVIGVFVGHDHNNDYLADIDSKIVLAYGRKTGYPPAYEEVLSRGARIVILREDKPSFETYIVDSSGTSLRYEFTKISK